MSLTKQVTQKLDQFGIGINNDYEVEKKSEHVFYTDEMILFVNDGDSSISVTFKATTKPERSATLALILNQVDDAAIHIMEGFIFNEDNQFLSGEKAYNLIERYDKTKLIEEYHKQRIYQEILESEHCHEC